MTQILLTSLFLGLLSYAGFLLAHAAVCLAQDASLAVSRIRERAKSPSHATRFPSSHVRH